ncbi:MAG: RsbRD N-terminal domain-containing protein [Acidobacteria bacterium]|nr:RsbRD N-terminal domain-containing protein [Acidobacteriota bacterium]
MTHKGLPLSASLANQRENLVRKWFDGIAQAYPESTTRFLAREKDPFQNPIGHTLKENLSVLFDKLIQPKETASLTTELNDIVRMRAVQDFSAGQAVSFPFLLKKILREECTADVSRYPEEFADLEARIDEMALLAFDLFMKSRERLYEIKYNEAKRSMFMLEKTRQNGNSRQ